MVGQLPSPEKPYLNQIIKNEECEVYLLSDGSGEVGIQVRLYELITPKNLKQYEDKFLEIVLGLMSHDVDHLVSWVPQHAVRLAEYFGFEETGHVRAFRDDEGDPFILREMLYTFPELDNGTDA
jgi:hypothetical protein